MGTTLIRLIAEGGEHQLVGALGEPGDPSLGRDAGQVAGIDPLGVLITDDLAAALGGSGGGGCDVAIDFTAPVVTARHAQACAANGHALVVGTTGLGATQLAALQAAARRTPVLHARNMSLGITVLTELVRQAVTLLGPGFDVEITEAHHRDKKDSPSGTALQLGEAAAAARGRQLSDVAVQARSGLAVASRAEGAIGFASLRGGAIVGDHTVLLAGAEELLELTHRATDRALFARGALRAASWLVGQPAGLYSLREVLGLPA
jgi:4-hydroxy-tetrahydrodipicolinate reductase